jgi:hypothetical protein
MRRIRRAGEHLVNDIAGRTIRLTDSIVSPW